MSDPSIDDSGSTHEAPKEASPKEEKRSVTHAVSSRLSGVREKLSKVNQKKKLTKAEIDSEIEENREEARLYRSKADLARAKADLRKAKGQAGGGVFGVLGGIGKSMKGSPGGFNPPKDMIGFKMNESFFKSSYGGGMGFGGYGAAPKTSSAPRRGKKKGKSKRRKSSSSSSTGSYDPYSNPSAFYGI